MINLLSRVMLTALVAVLIAGFVIGGIGSKRVVIRGMVRPLWAME